MRIGEVDVATSVPGDLDGRLRASMGVSALEVLRLLGGYCMPGLLARFVEPIAEGSGLSRGELTVLIVKAGVTAVRVDLAELYREACGVEAPASTSATAPVEEEELTVDEYCRRYMAGEGREDPAMLQFAANNGEAIEGEFHRINEAAQAELAKAAADPGQKRKRKK